MPSAVDVSEVNLVLAPPLICLPRRPPLPLDHLFILASTLSPLSRRVLHPSANSRSHSPFCLLFVHASSSVPLSLSPVSEPLSVLFPFFYSPFVSLPFSSSQSLFAAFVAPLPSPPLFIAVHLPSSLPFPLPSSSSPLSPQLLLHLPPARRPPIPAPAALSYSDSDIITLVVTGFVCTLRTYTST